MPSNSPYGPYVAMYPVSVLSSPNKGDYFLAADDTAIYPPLSLGDTVQFLSLATFRPCSGHLAEVCAIGASKVLFHVTTDTGEFRFLCGERACRLDLWMKLRSLVAPDKWLGIFDGCNYTPRIPHVKSEDSLPTPPSVCCWSLLSSSKDDWAQPTVRRYVRAQAALDEY